MNKLKKYYRYWQIFWRFRRLQAMLILEYRGNFIFWSVVAIMWTFFNFFFFDLLLNVNGTIGGWTRPEMHILIATFTILDSFTWSFFYPNMSRYTSTVFSGEFGKVLTRPIDAQFMLSIEDNSYNNVFRLVIGVWYLVKSVFELGQPIAAWQIILYLAMIGVSLLFIYGIWFIIATFAFWIEKLDNINETVPATRRLWQLPRSVFTGITSTVFTVLLPLGLIGSVPSEILVGRASWLWIAYLTIFTLVVLIIGRLFFFYSVRKFAAVGN